MNSHALQVLLAWELNSMVNLLEIKQHYLSLLIVLDVCVTPSATPHHHIRGHATHVYYSTKD